MVTYMCNDTVPKKQFPEEYTAPELITYGPLRQMIRGAGSPTRADFSSLDANPNDGVNTCLGDPSDDGGELFDSDCNGGYFPF